MRLLDILADLSLEALTSLLLLFDGAVFGKLVGSASHLTLCHSAREQLLHKDTHYESLHIAAAGLKYIVIYQVNN